MTTHFASTMLTGAAWLALGLVVNLATSQEIQFLEDPQVRQLKVLGTEGVEQTWWFDKKLRIPGVQGTSVCRVLRGLVTPMVVQELLELIGPGSSMRYSTGRDSVDEMPTFEYYPMTNKTWRDEKVGHVLKDVMEEVVLPYVRETYACETCVVGEILVRRYLPEERRTHNLHFDSHAFATVVLGLTSPDKYQGGLYIQSTPHIRSRRYVPLEPGDLFVHSFDLQHGVRLWQGERYSLVFWIKTSEAAVFEGTTPWYDEAVVELERLQQEILTGRKLQMEAVHGPGTTLSLVSEERRWLQKHRAFVEGWGFRWRAGAVEDEVVVTHVPNILGTFLAPKDLKGVISSAEASQVGGKASVPPVILHILTFKACRRAIKFGDHLDEVQMRRLMKELSKCDFPFQCAHGRPTVYPLASLAQLEDRGRLTTRTCGSKAMAGEFFQMCTKR